MRDYDEIISTLTEDEKIQLVLAKTSFTKELCDKIDDNLYSFFNTSIDKQLTNQTFDLEILNESELFLDEINPLVNPKGEFSCLNQSLFKAHQASEIKSALEYYNKNKNELTKELLESEKMITEEELNDAVLKRLSQINKVINSGIYNNCDIFKKKVNDNSFVILKNENLLPIKKDLKIYIDDEDSRLGELAQILKCNNFKLSQNEDEADFAITYYSGSSLDEISINSLSLSTKLLVVATELVGDALDKANAIIYSPAPNINSLYQLIVGQINHTGRLAYDDEKYLRGMGEDLYPVKYVSATYNNGYLKAFLKNELDVSASSTILICSEGRIIQIYNACLDAKEEKTFNILLNAIGERTLYIGPSVDNLVIEVSVNNKVLKGEDNFNYSKYATNEDEMDSNSNLIENKNAKEEIKQSTDDIKAVEEIILNDNIEPQYIIKREKQYKPESENDYRFSKIPSIKNKKDFISVKTKRIISIILNIYFEAAIVFAIVMSYINAQLPYFIISIVLAVIVEILFVLLYFNLHKREKYLVEAFNKDCLLDAMECQNFENVTKERVELPTLDISEPVNLEEENYVANSFDATKSSKEVVDSLVSYFASRGLGITNAKALELISAMHASRLIVIKDKREELLKKALLSIRMFFGTSPSFVDMKDKALIENEFVASSKLYANIFNNKENVNVQALENVNKELLEDIANKFDNYLLNPDLHKSFKNISLPSNLWFIVTPDSNYYVSENLLKNVFVIDLHLEEVEPITYNIFPVNYESFDKITKSIKKLDLIAPEVWNIFDTLEHEYNIRINNQTLRQIEIFLNSCLMNDGVIQMGVDAIISDKFVPYLMGLDTNNDHVSSLGKVLSAYDSTSTIEMINSYNN